MYFRRTSAIASANSLDKIMKFLSSDCDAIILDLEDGVPFPEKPNARNNVNLILSKWDFRGKERTVRVNSISSDEYLKDMEGVISKTCPDSIRVPKCETKEDIYKVDRDLTEIEKKAGLKKNSIEILALIETPIGIRNTYEIASCCDRVTAICLGMEDLTRTLGIRRRYVDDELDLIYARQKIVLDSKAAEVNILDSALLIIGDYDAVICHARDSKQMGFDGRSIGDPSQALAINRIYSYSEEEVQRAKEMKTAYEGSLRGGESEAFLGQQLICFAAYENALNILKTDEMRQNHAKKLGLQY